MNGRQQAGKRIRVTPSARRLVTSLRDIGYTFETAVADLVDNSLSARATRVDVGIEFAGLRSKVTIADDGAGMTEGELDEALRFGTRREYNGHDLGRFGLGLKTASISQGRRLTVVTRRAQEYRRLYSRVLDLDRVADTDRWEIVDARRTDPHLRSAQLLESHPGTVITIEHLDRVLPERSPEGGWAKRRFLALEKRTVDYLAMVFHRLIERGRVRISVNGKRVRPWNPFAPRERRTLMPAVRLDIDSGGAATSVKFRGCVLPSRERFSSPAAFDRLAGPRRWNGQQGLYIYRADRMVQSGGWCGLRALDEHTKLARAALDFDTDLDEFFRINVAKMKVALPAQVRTPLQRPIRELCQRAQLEYRRAGRSREQRTTRNGVSVNLDLCLALTEAAVEVGEIDALSRILEQVRRNDPALARSAGW